MSRSATKLYVIFDTVAETLLGSVMIAPNDLAASRAFAAAVTNPQHAIGENPADYRLLRLGTISDFGDITPEDPSIVITGSQVITEKGLQ